MINCNCQRSTIIKVDYLSPSPSPSPPPKKKNVCIFLVYYYYYYFFLPVTGSSCWPLMAAAPPYPPVHAEGGKKLQPPCQLNRTTYVLQYSRPPICAQLPPLSWEWRQLYFFNYTSRETKNLALRWRALLLCFSLEVCLLYPRGVSKRHMQVRWCIKSPKGCFKRDNHSHTFMRHPTQPHPVRGKNRGNDIFVARTVLQLLSHIYLGQGQKKRGK